MGWGFYFSINITSMKYTFIPAMFAVASLIMAATPPPQKALAYQVDPFIGTDWVGNTYPGANAPFGMVQLSPDNGIGGWDRIAGYFYPDTTIAGFSHTHLSGTGAGDLYDISFMPTIRPLLQKKGELGIYARFKHNEEEAHAGYYKVKLQPYNITVELTATERIGVQKYTFNRASDSAIIYLNLDKATNWDRTQHSSIKQVSSNQLIGYRKSDGWARNQSIYFFSRLSQAPQSISYDSIPHYHPSTKKLEGWGYIAKLHYQVKAGDTLLIETAISGVSEEGAQMNLHTEGHFNSFSEYRNYAENRWNKQLRTIQLDSSTPEDISKIFYTALYHAQLCPTLYNDADGWYLGADLKPHRTRSANYSTFSLWDTYRTAHPLYNILFPKENGDMVQSLISFGAQNNDILPVWNMWASETDMMIGHHSLPVIAGALEAGTYQVTDKEQLKKIVLSTVNRTNYRGMDEYRRLGYVPADKHKESLSLTMEYAYDDWAAARILQFLGYKEEAKVCYERSHNYRNLWNESLGYFAPRLSDGSFKKDFNPFAYTDDVTESNAYQYLWSAQHEPDSLIKLMGGREAFAGRLDKFFSDKTPHKIKLPIFSTGMIGQYAHGNEPSHHVPYLYHYAYKPWKTADYTHQIMRSLYTSSPRGLCGNEDCGQMSAWYVASAIGLYPEEGANKFLISSPIVASATIQLADKKTFTIKANNLSLKNKYIKSVKLNGKPWNKANLDIKDIQAGGVLELEMTNTPGITWYQDL